MSPQPQSKSELREAIKGQLKQQKPHLNLEIQSRLVDNLSMFLKKQNGLWAGFKPHTFEVDWQPVISECRQIEWVWPRVDGQDLVFIKEPTHFSVGYKKILEPQNGEKVEPEKIQGYLVPGLAFDFQGNRLGHGAGFYDRALAKRSSQETQSQSDPIKVGICFSIQYLNSRIPTESHDVTMDFVVTEEGVFN